MGRLDEYDETERTLIEKGFGGDKAPEGEDLKEPESD